MVEDLPAKSLLHGTEKRETSVLNAKHINSKTCAVVTMDAQTGPLHETMTLSDGFNSFWHSLQEALKIFCKHSLVFKSPSGRGNEGTVAVLHFPVQVDGVRRNLSGSCFSTSPRTCVVVPLSKVLREDSCSTAPCLAALLLGEIMPPS